MPNSMTGFGRSVVDSSLGTLTVEVQSVNRKYLEVAVSLPRELSRFESSVRKAVSEKLSRGQVFVRVFLTPNEASCLPDVSLLKELKKGFEKISKEIGAESQAIDLPFLMQYLPQSAQAASDKDERLLQEGVDEALRALVQMQKTEGTALAKDLSQKLQSLSKSLEQLQRHTPDAANRMRERLRARLQEAAANMDLEDRILREVAILAEKVDVTEEITRLHSHFSQFKELLKGEGVGRKMDFLIQEMAREINTIGSKSQESAITTIVVDMKSELEKMREQVQNLE